MKRSSRHSVDTQTLQFSVFSGGLNLRSAAENIEDNQLSDCANMTYSTQPGRLRTREGIGAPVCAFEDNVDGMCWYKGSLVVVCGRQIYVVTTAGVKALLGEASSTLVPSFVEFGEDLFIATGGKIQKFDGSVLSTVDDSPAHTVGLYARAGRVFCWERNSDTIRGSAVGNASIWTVPDSSVDSDPVDVQIGYKVAGNIVACVPLMNEVIVFKQDCVLRLGGEYPDWEVKEISRDEAIANSHSAVEVAGFLYYVERSKGARLLQSTEGYNEVAPGETLIDVNPWIRMNMDAASCRVWHLPARNIILLGAGNSVALPSYYEFGLRSMPTLKWTFYGVLHDVVEVDRDHLYLAIGTNIHDMNLENVFDWTPTEGQIVPMSDFTTKTYLPLTDYLVKRVMVAGSALSDLADEEPVEISLGGEHILDMQFTRQDAPFVYEVSKEVFSNDNDLFSAYWQETIFEMHNPVRLDDIQLHIDGSRCPFELSKITVELVQIGVNT